MPTTIGDILVLGKIPRWYITYRSVIATWHLPRCISPVGETPVTWTAQVVVMKTLGEAQGAGPFFGKSWEKGGENLEKLLEKGRTSFSCLRNLLDYGMFFAGTPPIFHGKNTMVTVF